MSDIEDYGKGNEECAKWSPQRKAFQDKHKTPSPQLSPQLSPQSSYYFRASPSPSPPLGNRHRLDTEETAKIKNNTTSLLCTEETPAGYSKRVLLYEREPTDHDDELSIVSGLSKDDDSYMAYCKANLTPTSLAKTPPCEVLISYSPPRDKVQDSALYLKPLTPLTIAGESPVVPRPTMSRNVSCKQQNESFHSLPTIPTLQDGMFHHQPFPHKYDDIVTCHHDLLGNRKRLLRSPSCGSSSITVGTLVGQSSLKTALTLASEFSSDASVVKRNFQTAHVAERLLEEHHGFEKHVRKKSVVKDEVKHFLGVVTSPLKLFMKPKAYDLSRSKGTLT